MLNIVDNIENIIPQGDSFEIVVTGRSMLPLLGYGRDTILVRRVAEDYPILNRIAMFRATDGRIVVHRVIKDAAGEVVLQGDGNVALREHCRRDEVIGVVERVVRQSGRVVDCTSRWWRFRERVWLAQPLIVRRYALAVMHRWLNFKEKQR
jgi:hypothetical protein